MKYDAMALALSVSAALAVGPGSAAAAADEEVVRGQYSQFTIEQLVEHLGLQGGKNR